MRRAAIALCLIALCLLGCAVEARPDLAEVPELARAIDADPDEAVVEIELAAGPADLEILPGVRTAGLAYRDLGSTGPATMPGTLIEVTVGQTLAVWLRNDLEAGETSLHFHGMRVRADLDANPIVTVGIDPGRTRLHRFVVQDPGLYWFHPHMSSEEHVELGMQGLVVVRAPDEPRAARERIFVLDDVDLAPDGSIVIEADHLDHDLGRFGSTLLVNGRPPGRVEAIAGVVERWRIVNTANGRHFALALGGGRRFQVIGFDGPPLAEPYETEVLELAPGERRDVLVTLDGAAGDAVSLETLPIDRGVGLGEWEASSLVRVDLAAGDPGPIVRAVDFAKPVERLEIDAAPVRRLELEISTDSDGEHRMTINGAVWPFGDPLRGRLDDVEVWEIANLSDLQHPFHVHGTFFQVVDRDGIAAARHGWHDTVAIGAHETLRIALRYDAPGRWMFHCQIPEHAHMGMMGDVIVRE